MIKNFIKNEKSGFCFNSKKDDPFKDMLYRDQATYWSKKYHKCRNISRATIIGLMGIVFVSIIINFFLAF